MGDGAVHVGIREALGESPAFLAFQERLSRAAKVDRPVLLVGERGTGKELAAAKLHYLSARWQGPLVALNCAALTATLVESELFGHEAGAYTGAARQRKGRFEAADEGSLFLDEVAVIPVPVQEKILRTVEYGTFERVGSTSPIQVDVRIIGATNSNLKALADAGEFLHDLLDRLSFDVLVLPPLRDRPEDIPLLARHFAARMARELGREDVPSFSAEALRQLLDFAWPGNIRELKNVVERAVYRADARTIRHVEFDPFAGLPLADSAPGAPAASAERPAVPPPLPASFPDAVAAFELDLVRRALRACGHHQGRAAKRLGLTYHQFRGLYRKYGERLEDEGA